MRGYKGILVYVQVCGKKISDVSEELLAAGRRLADERHCPLYLLLAGYRMDGMIDRVSGYGAARVYLMDGEPVQNFRETVYGEILVECIRDCMPEIVLIGSTPEGKSTAAYAAAKLKTGLTADCTGLTLNEEGLLVQTRPAYGGRLMADILTKTARPQMVTVRRGVLNNPCPACGQKPEIKKLSGVEIQGLQIVSEYPCISDPLLDAEIILAVGAGVRKREDISLFQSYAEKMHAQLASSRALVERGWMPPQSQIGLSGQAVAPKLLICCGISGSVQFCAGIRGAKKIIAVNTDRSAPVFREADFYIIGDMYKIFEKY